MTVARVDNTTCNITVDIAGESRVQFMDRDGNVGSELVRCTPTEAGIALNCVSAGWWGQINKGLIVSWKAPSALDKFIPDRIIELSSVVPDPIEYEVVSFDESELSFLMVVDHTSGQVQYVGDIMAGDPFVDTFEEGRMFYYDLPGIDNIIQRGYVEKVVRMFMDMWDTKYEIHHVYARIKA